MAVPTLVSGDLATDTINQSQRVVDMDDSIAQLEPDAAPLTLLLRKLRKQPAISPKVEWLEDERMPRITTTSASAASNASSVSVTDNIFRVGDVVRDSTTGEALEVTATASGSITVNRAIGSVAAAAVGSGDELYIVANVNAEGASLRQIKVTKLVNAYNYCEIVRTPMGITGTEAASKLYGGPDRDRLQAYSAIEHMRQWENVFFFGARKEDTSTSGAPKRFCGGLQEYIATNKTTGVGTLSESTFQDFLRTGFRFGSDRKVLFASPLLVKAIEGFARSTIKTETAQTHGDTFGISMKTYVSGQGVVDIVMHRDWNDSATYKGYGFLVDVDALKYRPLRDTKLLENRQANDADKIEDEYLTEASLELQHERKHALITGVTG